MNIVRKWLGMTGQKYSLVVCLFLVLSFISGMATMLLREPMTWLDEHTHYARAIQLAKGDLFVSPNNDVSQMGGYITTGQERFIQETLANRSLENKKRSSTVSLDWLSYYDAIDYGSERLFYANTNTVPYTPTSYLPYIGVAYINQYVKASPVVEYTWMRIVGFLSAFLLALLAIKVLPFGKLTLAMLLSSPTVVASFSAVTADGINIALAMLFIAYVLNIVYQLANDKPLLPQQLASLVGLMVVVALAKMPTFFLIGLIVPVLSMPILHKKQKRHLVIALIASLVCVIVWLYIVRHINTGAFWGRKVSTGGQLLHILSDVPKFIFVFLMTLARYDFLSMQLGYTNTVLYISMPMFVSLSYYVSVLFSACLQDQDYDKRVVFNVHTNRFNTVKYGLFVFIVCAIFGILYLQFSEVGSLTIDGVQPRYFIPFFPLIFLQSTRFRLPNRLVAGAVVVVGILPTLTYMIMLMMQYFRVS